MPQIKIMQINRARQSRNETGARLEERKRCEGERERESVKETHSRKIKFGRERDMETGLKREHVMQMETEKSS